MIDVENQDKQKPELIATLKLSNVTNSTGLWTFKPQPETV